MLPLNVSFNLQLQTYAYLFGETANDRCSGSACARKYNEIVSKFKMQNTPKLMSILTELFITVHRKPAKKFQKSPEMQVNKCMHLR